MHIPSKQTGFTLIELLVVIAVIGMLASIVLVAFGPARGKGRDARRISDVQQISIALEVEASDNVEDIDGCSGVNDNVRDCTGPGAVADFNKFLDPSSTAPGTPCTPDSNSTCQYSISRADGTADATTGDYQICFYLEQGSGNLAAGMHAIESNGVFSACE